MPPISPEELQELCQRIINSGELGRSRTYREILKYLVECSIKGEQPKEVAIAMDVLGRESDFDVGKDSIVRVNIYHLRNKLNSYFERHGESEPWRIEIPKGQYLISTVKNQSKQDQKIAHPISAKQRSLILLPWLLLGLACAALFALLLVQKNSETELDRLRQLSPWQEILDDQAPILVVVGDYYIFGELDDSGNVSRMVRDFEINSESDLETLLMMEQDLYGQYYNLGLSYIPNGAASAISSIMPVLYDQQHRVSVRMMSELNATDLTTNHVIYVGYISALGILEEWMFASSHLSIGSTYDELYTAEGDYFVSSSGILNSEQEFRDFGMISSFPSPGGNQFILIAGMRDAGLITVAQALSDEGSMIELMQSLQAQQSEQAPEGGEEQGWESLYEVFGFDHTNFDASRVYAGRVNPERIWGGEL